MHTTIHFTAFARVVFCALLLSFICTACGGSGSTAGNLEPEKAAVAKPVKPPPDPEPPAGDPAISYFAAKKGSSVICVMDADGSNQRDVITQYNVAKTWSPDGLKLALTYSDQAYRDSVATINLDGSGLEIIRTGLDRAHAVAWSPAPVYGLGERIAYCDSPNPLGLDIWLVSPDGTEVEQITDTPDDYELYPTWSPDATKLAYYRTIYGADGVNFKDIWIHDFTTGVATRVDIGGPFTSRDESYTDLDWANTQDKIVFCATTSIPSDGVARNGFEIWVVDLNDPANPVQLTNDPSRGYVSPSWSPDDSEIVYTLEDRVAGDGWEIWKMNADGTGKTLLLAPGGAVKSVFNPDWKR